ncbi:dinuclear metal center YbgI/SA1388 family protein [Microbacteriaceae bacterium SG_E_30_P1]|uniref:GTP cyclohydrolase 1 type 2 homolog n=1 Tax=Antiquaquibacter oligotrophicus TaxID=2880260 RepID=A0ABT6KNR6_9MICO|nr:Nif3-like dinuclear metal center hexameric protein [Antiquaquibacter oligotrophicus]MDH6181088.1 dinuclear metal center YbgI/SA1388 family protein [Antiquaquibacter oligotrophicus]UDF13214.1 Nif3-like dinuclear metal center hexameric protein [Antiquaquibacter oligotrophicus]
MSTTLADVLDAVERLWPVSGAESWDAVGLISGDPRMPVSSIHLAVDAATDTVDEAIEQGSDVLLVHHPLLLRGVTSVAADRYKGAVLTRLIKADCALIAAHTNADIVENGTSGTLASRLGLLDVRPIIPSTDPQRGLGRIGRFERPVALGTVARALGEVLPATATGIRVAGDFDAPISSVALCAGAGDSLLSHPDVLAADVYITSDLRHHPASEARENARVAAGPALVDVSHWASEWLWLDSAAEDLARELPALRISVSDLRTDPWDFVVTQ